MWRFSKILNNYKKFVIFIRQAEANNLPTYSEMTPFQKYWFIKRTKDEVIKIPVHRYPKYTKVQIPIDPIGTPIPKVGKIKSTIKDSEAVVEKKKPKMNKEKTKTKNKNKRN